LAVGAALLGISTFGVVPQSASIHALTAGAIGTMTLAVMTRATRGHTGRTLSADGVTTSIFICITLAAVLRVSASLFNIWTMPLLMASASLWVAAFGLFTLAYGPMLIFPKRTV
jgi:uncharacterized protein involved in response to NO